MKQRYFAVSNKRLAAAAVILALAFALFAASLLEPKRPDIGEWVPLNGAVDAALEEMAELEQGAKETAATVTAGADTETQALVGAETEKEVEAEAQAEAQAQEEVQAEAEAEAGDTRLDINRASVAELDTLKGIGPAKAEAIVSDRERNGKFESVQDLIRVNGIGEKLLSGIQESIVARP